MDKSNYRIDQSYDLVEFEIIFNRLITSGFECCDSVQCVINGLSEELGFCIPNNDRMIILQNSARNMTKAAIELFQEVKAYYSQMERKKEVAGAHDRKRKTTQKPDGKAAANHQEGLPA